MAMLTLSDILDDLRAAEEGLHRFERRYWISSTHFYELYSKRVDSLRQHAHDEALHLIPAEPVLKVA